MFVAIEGIDGSGKGTQTNLLQQKALENGISCSKISFPQYGRTPFAEAIAEYLNGTYGDVDDVHPKLASLLFAGDRFAAKDEIIRARQTSRLVASDRYVASNLAHQSAKLDESQQLDFIKWLAAIEYGVYGLPQPELNLYLDVPVSTSQKLVKKKGQRSQFDLFSQGEVAVYTTQTADIHERNRPYLARCKRAYELLIEHSIGGKWIRLDCTNEQGEMRSQSDLQDELWSIVCGHLGR